MSWAGKGASKRVGHSAMGSEERKERASVFEYSNPCERNHAIHLTQGILCCRQQLGEIVSIRTPRGIYTQTVDNPIGFAESRRVIVHI